MRIKATIVTLSLLVQYFENATILVYTGLRDKQSYDFKVQIPAC